MEELLSTYEEEEEEEPLVPTKTRREYREGIENNQIIRGFEAAFKGTPPEDSGFKSGTLFHNLFQKGYGMFLNLRRKGLHPDVEEGVLEKRIPATNHTMKEIIQEVRQNART